MQNNSRICIVGAGLAGSECALVLAHLGLKVELYEMKPKSKTPAHHSTNYAEIVCSNSFKNKSLLSASGLLKHELEMLSSPLLSVANTVQVPAGQALAIDREKFEQKVTELIKCNKNITVHEGVEVEGLFENATTEGVVLEPSAFGMTTGSPPSITDTHEFVVPRSIPIIFAIIKFLLNFV